jgi:hypothetical protein
MTAILNTAPCSRSLATFLPGVAAIGCISVLGERLAKVCFSAFSLEFAGDWPKSYAVESDGLITAFVLSDEKFSGDLKADTKARGKRTFKACTEISSRTFTCKNQRFILALDSAAYRASPRTERKAGVVRIERKVRYAVRLAET